MTTNEHDDRRVAELNGYERSPKPKPKPKPRPWPNRPAERKGRDYRQITQKEARLLTISIADMLAEDPPDVMMDRIEMDLRTIG